MTVEAEYLGMRLELAEQDVENTTYFKFCAAREFRLQACQACGLIRYPPGTACPWCACREADWVPVEGRGGVHSYTCVHQAIQPAFKQFAPYLVLLVDLDTQKGKPTAHEALRVVGNLTTPDGTLAAPDLVAKVGIGTRVRMVFRDLAPGLSLPQWTIDEMAAQPVPWRYPG
jgi:uncharacterized OB-fold protein